ncbi:MAG: 2-dehydropantoate 2-reductase [candidate division NC10 bacterium]|nr:2-dehydropantoate 2-reductase [candidate division NC10 bacterium]
MLARAGAPVTLIGRRQHVEAMTRKGLFFESLHFQEYIPVSASTDVEAARTAGIVLLCVKTPDTEEAARSLAPHLASGAVLASLQNGVDNVERIRAVANLEAIPAVVYVAAEITAPGSLRHTGRGELIIGDLPGVDRGDKAGRKRLESLTTLFSRAGVPCRVSENIEADLWTKLIMNCAYNAMSALSRARYGQMVASPWTQDLMRQVVEEVLSVAEAAGVRMMHGNMVEAAWKLADTMPGAISSTAQDLARRKRTEIDSLNGYVARRGAELGIATPVNQTLHALVKLLEEAAAVTTG